MWVYYVSVCVLCANENPVRRNHCEDTRKIGAAEPRLGVWLGNPRRGANAMICVPIGTRRGGTIVRILGIPARQNRGWLMVLPLVTLTYYIVGDAGIMCQIL
ncbi:hypothetical protein RHMOL_Rhmol02G0153100 [Rhododendron molle]|uniref:Uncharacterized protein n=1 Tax=Rhododendron molle TaxID=49168 RepID=A0ACC0PS38_RHOML|nr:hypothetical protein RHMOL_Rhmol02G0153100 [Rhododendron molle]